MEGFTKRDYIVAILIISGVVAITMLIFATLLGVIKAELGLLLIAGLSSAIYWFVYRKPHRK